MARYGRRPVLPEHLVELVFDTFCIELEEAEYAQGSGAAPPPAAAGDDDDAPGEGGSNAAAAAAASALHDAQTAATAPAAQSKTATSGGSPRRGNGGTPRKGKRSILSPSERELTVRSRSQSSSSGDSAPPLDSAATRDEARRWEASLAGSTPNAGGVVTKITLRVAVPEAAEGGVEVRGDGRGDADTASSSSTSPPSPRPASRGTAAAVAARSCRSANLPGAVIDKPTSIALVLELEPPRALSRESAAGEVVLSPSVKEEELEKLMLSCVDLAPEAGAGNPA